MLLNLEIFQKNPICTMVERQGGAAKASDERAG